MLKVQFAHSVLVVVVFFSRTLSKCSLARVVACSARSAFATQLFPGNLSANVGIAIG